MHVDDQGRAPFPIFRLSSKARQSLLEWVKNDVKFPDGYVADLDSCADINGGKFTGMKNHDCHVFMERLLPFSLQNFYRTKRTPCTIRYIFLYIFI